MKSKILKINLKLKITTKNKIKLLSKVPSKTSKKNNPMKTKKKLKNQNLTTTTKNQIIMLPNQLRIPTITTNLLNLSRKKKAMKSITNELFFTTKSSKIY